MSVSISGEGSVTGIDQGLNVVGVVTATTISVGSGTSVSSPATNVLTLGTNNSERVRIGSTGSVGIGTNESYGDSNASFTSLSLGGNGTRYGLIELNRSDGTAGSWIDCYGTAGNGDLRITTAGTSGAITFWTGGAFTEKVRIDSSGRLGIGTNNPTGNGDQTTIHVHAADYPVLHLTNSTTGTTTSDGSELTLNADGSLILRNRENSFIRFDTNGSERVRIDSSGRVTMPYQPAFSAYGDGITNPGTTPVKIPYTELTDFGGNFTNSEFTCPVSGMYHFYARHWFSSGYTGTAYLYLYLNGAAWKEARINFASTSTEYSTLQILTNSQLSANDIVSVYANSSSAAPGQFHSSSGSRYSEFSGHLIA